MRTLLVFNCKVLSQAHSLDNNEPRVSSGQLLLRIVCEMLNRNRKECQHVIKSSLVKKKRVTCPSKRFVLR